MSVCWQRVVRQGKQTLQFLWVQALITLITLTTLIIPALITLITSLLVLWDLSPPTSQLDNENKLLFTHLEEFPFLGSSFSCGNSSFFLSSLFHAACPKGRQNDRLRRTAVRTTVLLDARSDRCLVTVSLATVRTQKMRLWDPDIGKNDLDGKMKVWRIQLALFQPRHNSKELCECLIYLICYA